MKKILSILSMLLVLSAFGQTEPKYSVTVDVVKYREVPETLRDQYVVPIGERWKLFNTTADRWEQWNGSEWIAFGGDAAPILISEADFLLLDPEDIANNNYDIYKEKEAGSPSGGIQSVVAGTNISVDNSDPENPIVNAPNVATASVNFGNDNRLLKSSGTGKDIQATGIVVSDTNVIANVLEIVATDGTFTDVSANSIVKNGATNDDILLGDGSTVSLASLGSGATQLSELSDVNTSTPTNRNVLVADGTDWESRALVVDDINGFYQTGTFTPTIIDSSSGGTYTTSGINGKYTKIGNTVYVWIYIIGISTSGAPSGNLRIGNLPISASSNLHAISASTFTGSSVNFYSIYPYVYNDYIEFRVQSALDGNTSTMTSVSFTSGAIQVSGIYITD